MIARVRIAPVERWCKGARLLMGTACAGMEIQIITETLTQGQLPCCDGKSWDVTAESVNAIRVKNGKTPTEDTANRALCEHMLEMD